MEHKKEGLWLLLFVFSAAATLNEKEKCMVTRVGYWQLWFWCALLPEDKWVITNTADPTDTKTAKATVFEDNRTPTLIFTHTDTDHCKLGGCF